VRTSVSQVAVERQGRRDAFLAASFQAVRASEAVHRVAFGAGRDSWAAHGLMLGDVAPAMAPIGGVGITWPCGSRPILLGN
jgi:hypothetical protein